MINLMLLAIAVGSVAPAAAAAAGVSVTVAVTGTQRSGKVFAQVFGDAESFKARTGAIHQFSLEPDGTAGGKTTLTLPPGRYAIAMFQDTKGTGKLQTNMFGIPSVPYGFSNNARGTMGPPGFDAAAFNVGSAPVTVAIQLR